MNSILLMLHLSKQYVQTLSTSQHQTQKNQSNIYNLLLLPQNYSQFDIKSINYKIQYYNKIQYNTIQYKQSYMDIIDILLFFIVLQAWFPNRGPLDCQMELTNQEFERGDINENFTHVTKFVKNRTESADYKIPYYIFQTYEQDTIPWQMNYAVSSVIQKNPQFTYRYFNASQRREFIQDHLGKQVGAVYDKLVPNAYRADLWRYSVIYVYGGCYIDIAMVAIQSLTTLIQKQTSFISTPDGNKKRYYGVNSAFFCAAPGHQILKHSIDGIVKLVYQGSYGSDMLQVSGPLRFLDGFFKYYNISNGEVTYTNAQKYENNVVLYQRDQLFSMCVEANIQDFSNNIILYNKYPNYLVDTRRISDKPHYAVLYRNRQLYDKEIKLPSVVQNFKVPQHSKIQPFAKDYRAPLKKQDKHNSNEL